MAYLILSTDGQEWDRRELHGPIVIGRSPDCDISVHDILLSRRHCRFTPAGEGWLVIDLASRNGTLLRDQVVEQSKLKHGDVIRVGKTKVTFRTDGFVPMPRRADRPEFPPAIARDELLAGTVAGMTVPTPTAAPVRQSMHRPSPKPRPMDPVSFESDNLYSMLEQIASSSWDSIYATNSQPIRKNRQLPQPIVGGVRLPRHKLPMASLSLQVMPVTVSCAQTRTVQPGATHMEAAVADHVPCQAGDGVAGLGDSFLTLTPVLRYSEEPGGTSYKPGSSEYLRTGVINIYGLSNRLLTHPVIQYF